MKFFCKIYSYMIGLMVLGFIMHGQKTTAALPSDIPLKQGDKSPDIVFNHLINYPSSTARLSDFKNKLIILDFWDTYCGACIASWPHLLDIQKEFEGKIQIILVNAEQNDTAVRRSFERKNKLSKINMSLPAQCGDSTFKMLFPYSSLPHLVWIDKGGVVRFFTYSNAVTKHNIQALLDNRPINILPDIGNADLIAPDWSQPLFYNGNGGEAKKVYWQSTFARGDQKIWPGIYVRSIPAYNKYFIGGNGCIRDLYRVAYSDRMSVPAPGLDGPAYLEPILLNRIILEVRDTTQYVDYFDHEYRYDNHFVYQLIPPGPTSVDKLQVMMRLDLERYIGLKAVWRTMKMKCLVFSSLDTTLYQYKTGKVFRWIDINDFKVNNLSMKSAIHSLENEVFGNSAYPLVDETGFKGKVGNISIEGDIQNFEGFNQQLKKYGLTVKLEDREQQVLDIGEPPGFQFPFEPYKFDSVSMINGNNQH